MKVEVEMSFVTLKNPRAIIVVTVFNGGVLPYCGCEASMKAFVFFLHFCGKNLYKFTTINFTYLK